MKYKASLPYTALACGIGMLHSAALMAQQTATPIEHVIVVIGENVTFDTLYGAYQPGKRQSIKNLLSQGIINADGSPGKHYAKALQKKGLNQNDQYTVSPQRLEAFATLPQPLQTGILDPATFSFKTGIPDPRFPTNLPNGPFQISKYAPYADVNSATGDPVHRFFQMWQQTGGTNRDRSLFTWVATTVGTGGENGKDSPTPDNAQQGGELMGFFNMSQGDAPVFKKLADDFALNDNYHQAIMGGTGANFFAIATADVAVYNEKGLLAAPPANQIENPNPKTGTQNFYQQDGYAGGSYVNCSDAKQPGVASILRVLDKHHRASGCEKDAYYLVNNYDVPYQVDGALKALGADKFVYPPQTVPTIGELLSSHNISWAWYTAGRDNDDILKDDLYPVIRASVDAKVPKALPEPDRTNLIYVTALETGRSLVYNSIGDPHNASSKVVNTPALREHLKGMTSLMKDINQESLPAVSFVVPKNLLSGHPGYSAPVRYELFIKDLVAQIQAKPALWANTAIIITTDEGGGYFDSGEIQNLDFFGDGPRIPFLVVSPYAKKGHVDHTYHDHASILKFIEHNWALPPLSARSRDNLPNPQGDHEKYIPSNQPAVGDLTSLFDFKQCRLDGRERHEK